MVQALEQWSCGVEGVEGGVVAADTGQCVAIPPTRSGRAGRVACHAHTTVVFLRWYFYA